MSKDLFRGLANPEMPTNYNHFDLSRRHLFTAEPGFLKPVLCLECVPDDKIKINVGAMLRTMPLTTAAFLRCKGFFHFYFVPYSQLWRKWPEFLEQRDDPTSSYEKGFNYVPTFNFKTLMTDLETDTSTFPNSAGANLNMDVFLMNPVGRACELVDMLGYGHPRVKKNSSGTGYSFESASWQTSAQTPELHVNPFRAAAYQKIWSDYYRNPYYDPQVPVTSFNFDDFDCSSVENAKWANNRSDSPAILFMPRYRGYKKDLFMGTMPSTQDGAVSSISITGINIQNIGAQVPSGAISNIRVGITSNSGVYSMAMRNSDGTFISNSSNWNINNAFDVLALKRAEALQRWKENTMRAGQRSQSQQKAHYGIMAKHIADTRCEYIGGFDFDIAVDEVVAQSSFVGSYGTETIGNELGQLAGKGIAVTPRNEINYHATEFGVLMCIFSALPESEYLSTGMDIENTLSQPFDFFTKEFENTGLVPLPRHVLDMKMATGANINGVLGYVPRYSYLKTGVDKVFGAFMNSLRSWVSPRFSDQLYVSSAGGVGILKGAYYVNPIILDSLFGVANDGTEDTDPFMINCHFSINALRNMSVLGLPNY